MEDAKPYDPAKLKNAIEALRNWFEMQSQSNAEKLYSAAFDLFDAKFDPTEYDSVE